MGKEAGWIATMLTVLLVVIALLSPRAEGQLPTLNRMERPPTAMYRVPLIGPIVGRVQRLVATVTWQLEAIPME